MISTKMFISQNLTTDNFSQLKKIKILIWNEDGRVRNFRPIVASPHMIFRERMLSEHLSFPDHLSFS